MYPWYFPPIAFLGILVVSRGLPVAAQRVTQHRAGAIVARCLQGVFMLGLLAVFVLASYQIRVQQKVCEDGTRVPVGRWLKEHAGPKETIYLECLGYVGFFSEGRMLDYPGLASPEVVKLRKETGGAFIAVSDDDILRAIPALARSAGVFAEPAGAAAYAGLVTAVDRQQVSGDEKIVVLNTGNGLKDVAGAMQALDLVQTRPFRVQPDFAAFEQVVAGWGEELNIVD